MGHEDAPAEVGLGHDVGQTGGMVQVEMGDQQDVHRAQVELVVEGEGSEAIIGGVDTSIEHNSFPLVLDDVAGAADLVTPTEAEEGEKVGFILNARDVF